MLNKINNVKTEDELFKQLKEEAKKRMEELEEKRKNGTITPEQVKELRGLLEKEIKSSENFFTNSINPSQPWFIDNLSPFLSVTNKFFITSFISEAYLIRLNFFIFNNLF